MFRDSKLSRYTVEKIMRHFCVDVTATQAAWLLGLNRKTVNRYYGMFRRMIYRHQIDEFEQLGGQVEVDESYFGRSRVRGSKVKLKRGRGTLKQPVFGIFERNGKVYTEVIPDCKKKTLQAIILGNISLDSAIHSDGWRGYDGLVDVGYDRHLRVNHSANEFAKNSDIHINGIESFWSFTKRRLAKFNGVKKNFELHLKECEWRWNQTPDALTTGLGSIAKIYQNKSELMV
jgi:transposase-like protein